MIEICNVSKIYENGVVALRDMSMQIPEKQRTVFFWAKRLWKDNAIKNDCRLRKHHKRKHPNTTIFEDIVYVSK